MINAFPQQNQTKTEPTGNNLSFPPLQLSAPTSQTGGLQFPSQFAAAPSIKKLEPQQSYTDFNRISQHQYSHQPTNVVASEASAKPFMQSTHLYQQHFVSLKIS